MIRKKKQADDHNDKNANSPYTYLSEDYSEKITDVVSELIAMRGILRLDILTLSGNLIYSYNRWGDTVDTLNETDALELLELLQTQLQKASKKKIDHFIIRSDDANFIAFSNKRIYLFLQCDKKCKLPFITIKAKRITSEISLLV